MDLDTMLAAASPASRASLDGPDSPAAIGLYQRITAPTAAPADERRATVRRRFLLPGTGAVAAAAAVTVVLTTLPGSPIAPLPAAAAVLDQAAATAANQPTTRPGPGQYFYLKTSQTIGVTRISVPGSGHPRFGMAYSLFGNVSGSGVRRCTVVSQLWLASDGGGRLVWTPQPGRPGTGTPACRAYTQTFPGNSSGANPFFPVVRGSLPLRPSALERVIAHRYGDGKPDITTLYAASELLVDGQSPALRAAVYRVIERLPGLRDLGSVRDLLGRGGIAVAFTDSGVRDEIIFDPATSAILETRSMAWPAGTQLGYTLFLTSGVVRTPAATRPAAGGASR